MDVAAQASDLSPVEAKRKESPQLWPTIVADSVRSRFSEDFNSKNKVENDFNVNL